LGWSEFKHVDHLSRDRKRTLFVKIRETVRDKVIPIEDSEDDDEDDDEDEETGGGGESKSSNKKRDMPKAIEKFKEWFDECIEPDDTDEKFSEEDEAKGRFWLSNMAPWKHYKSWCKAEGVLDSLKYRCDDESCKQKGCSVETCKGFKVHWCHALGVKDFWKDDPGNRTYRAYFKNDKAKILEMGGSAKSGRRKPKLVKNAEYKKEEEEEE